MKKYLAPYFQLTRLNRPVGILLLLWPTLWALWLAARGWPGWRYLLIFTLGTVLMRSAGCIINDYADRNFDLYVARTRQRPLAQGTITPRSALVLFFILMLLALGLVLLLNPITQLLSVLSLGLAVLYPLTKRFFTAPQLFLGLAFGGGILMSFAAINNALPQLAWELYVANIIWVLIYDTEYAMVDRNDDIKLPIYSTAMLFGRADRLIIGILQLLFISTMLLIGQQLQLKEFYYLALAVVAGLFIYQQQLLAKRDIKFYFIAFTNNQWVGLAIFIGLWLTFQAGAGVN